MYKEEKVTPKSALRKNLVSILQAMLGMGSGTEVWFWIAVGRGLISIQLEETGKREIIILNYPEKRYLKYLYMQ